MKQKIKKMAQAITPGPRARNGATAGLGLGMAFYWAMFSYFHTSPHGISSFFTGTLSGLIIAAVIGGVFVGIFYLFSLLPRVFAWVLIGTVLWLIYSFFIYNPFALKGFINILPLLVLIPSLIGAGAWILINGGWTDTTVVQRILTLAGLGTGFAGLVFGTLWLFHDGPGSARLPDAEKPAGILHTDMPDPSQTGSYKVISLSYGNGKDRHQSEYAKDADLVTNSVDGSILVKNWTQRRTDYWGFDQKAMPINGLVWYPEGNGPFPLVLMVHGNHLMEDFSEPGYEYLGRVLASRGFIAASVDQNFLNSSSDGIEVILGEDSFGSEENDARGWLLLEHIRTWKTWNETPDNLFFQKVDMDNIGLLGHSRGGQAVSVAAGFNRLSHYPDNAALSFEYNYNIRSVIALAPDDRYRPAGKGISLENINYLTMQGVHDMDLPSFAGLHQYERVRFTDSGDWFKAVLYISGANHGQFNTVWGRTDLIRPLIWLYNLKQLMPGEEQRQVAKVYVSAFLEATLHNESGYLPLFRDYRAGAKWLPDTVYLSRCEESSVQLVTTYEEDIDVITTTLPGGNQDGRNLTVWREHLVTIKWGKLPFGMNFGDMGSNAVYLGWDAKASGDTASYSIVLPENRLSVGADSTLVFLLADANEDPQGGKSWKSEPVDLTLEVADQAGETARLALSSFSYIQPQLEGQLFKAESMSGMIPISEMIFQSFEYPMSAFVNANPAFNPGDIKSISFIFDRTPAGVIALDNLGFRNAGKM